MLRPVLTSMSLQRQSCTLVTDAKACTSVSLQHPAVQVPAVTDAKACTSKSLQRQSRLQCNHSVNARISLFNIFLTRHQFVLDFRTAKTKTTTKNKKQTNKQTKNVIFSCSNCLGRIFPPFPWRPNHVTGKHRQLDGTEKCSRMAKALMSWK